MRTDPGGHRTAPAGPRADTGDGLLADPGWLAAHLADADLRVVEVDVSRAAYDDWHIDGAVLWNVYADLKDAGDHTVDEAALKRLMARSGIGPHSTVVFYGYAPARAAWLMTVYGHRRVRIPDCSRDTWRAGGYPWTTVASEPPAASYRLAAAQDKLAAALGVYGQLSGCQRDRLGGSPSPATRGLCQRLLAAA
jgi:thiosulfate/3-mercaptopyruvate sulfurtransferase